MFIETSVIFQAERRKNDGTCCSKSFKGKLQAIRIMRHVKISFWHNFLLSSYIIRPTWQGWNESGCVCVCCARFCGYPEGETVCQSEGRTRISHRNVAPWIFAWNFGQENTALQKFPLDHPDFIKIHLREQEGCPRSRGIPI